MGNASTATYRGDHQPSRATDPTGVETAYAYLDNGALSSVKTPGAGTTVFTTNPDGTIETVTSPDGVTTRSEYDRFGRPISQLDGAGRATRTVYNPDGTISAVIAPDAVVTRTTYDEARRPVAIEDALGSLNRFGYDRAGNQTEVVDPRGAGTNFEYDAAYNLTETRTSLEEGGIVSARFTYDAANRLATATGPRDTGTSTYAYTPTGRLALISGPDGARTEYSYTSRGETAQVKSADGTRTTYTYDAAGRLIESDNSTEGTTTYTYDAAGRLLGVVDGRGNSNLYQYDAAGRLLLAADDTGLEGGPPYHPYAVAQTLSPGGRRASHSQGLLEFSAGGFMPVSVSLVDYSYNDDGSISALSSPELIGEGKIGFEYDDQTGRLASLTLPGAETNFGYDALARTTEQSTRLASGEVFEFPTRYNGSGNVIRLAGSTYTYDSLGRLKTAHDGELGGDYEYQYDLASNRTRVTRNGEIIQSLTFGAADEISTEAHPEFSYDPAGRLISDTTPGGEKRHYIWDGSGRLKGVDLYSPETGQSENLRFEYDPSGRLSEKVGYLNSTWPTERFFYHYDGDRLVAEEDMTGIVREYLYAGGEAPTAMWARQSDGSYSQFFFQTNTHGEVVAVTDRDGTIVNRYAYGPWGEATRVSETVHQPFRYGGYRYEDGFDLYYLRARWMDPNTGRFLSRDAMTGQLSLLKTLNRYIYAEDNPPTLRDPSGLNPRHPRDYQPVSSHCPARTRACPGTNEPRPSLGSPAGYRDKPYQGPPELNPAAFGANTYTSVFELYAAYFENLPWLLDPTEESYFIPAFWSLTRQIYIEMDRDPAACHLLADNYDLSWEHGAIHGSASYQWMTLQLSIRIGRGFKNWLETISKPGNRPGRL